MRLGQQVLQPGSRWVRWWGAALGVIVVLLVIGVAIGWHRALPSINRPPAASFSKSAVAQGQELARLGNCAVCHTADYGRPFAGGRAIPTPFGTIFSSNITPDEQTGIGRWSLAAFTRAMRQGIDRAGGHLYPAFPYDHFTHLRDADIAALYAYLMTRDAVSARPPNNRLMFPFNIRFFMTGWNILFLREGPDPSLQNNRGAYLVQAIADCGGCHTPRNVFQAEKANRPLDGGTQQHWFAPPINGHSPAPVAWTTAELETYLRTGLSAQHGYAAGPMREVVHQLAQASPADVHAIAAYIAPSLASRPSQGPVDHGTGVSKEAQIYRGACAACHEPNATAVQGRWPSLANSTVLQEDNPRDTIQVLLQGIPWQEGTGDPFMPGFAASLTDKQVAALASYLRNRYSTRRPWPDLLGSVRGIRKEDHLL